jgi:D-alanyl-D-alanine carboxypeptidase/D-alanyl-D-alanine-endopeptidase (penicillin-binding protein 4)
MRKNFLLATLCSCLLGYSFAGAETVTQAVNHVLDTTHSRLRSANIGIVVSSLKTGRVLYSRNSNHLYTPASVQKLFTAAAALEYLKPNFTFKTGFYTRGHISGGVLHGDLYVKFRGDPSFKLVDLSRMMDELHDMHVDRIAGHVYIDNFAYNSVPYPPGWIWDDLSYSYAAPMNAIIMDHNKFAVTFIPAKHYGYKPKLESSLPHGVVHFVNNMKTTRTYSNECPITIYSDMSNQYKVGGCLDGHWGSQSRSLAVRNMLKYAEVEVADMLRTRGIDFKGQVSRKKAPHHPIPLVMHASRPLNELIRHMLKVSDNLYTNAIFKKIGEKYYSQPGGWQNSLHALRNILSIPTGIDFEHNLLADGAGLSRYNLITPHQLTKLLYFIYHNPTIKPALLAALPIAGIDGTLEGRMAMEGRSERVHAKTGSMTGVSTLAGYVTTRRHGTLAFAIMVNDFVGGLGPYRHLQDRICESLARV